VRQRQFGNVAPGPRPSPHRPRSMLRRSGSWRATPADPLAEHGIWGRPHQGAERHRRGNRRYPDGSNAGDVVKPVAGTPVINRAASIARKPRRSSKAWTFLSLARRMTVASCYVRPAVRASAKAASPPTTAPTTESAAPPDRAEGEAARRSEHRPREHRRREQDPRPEGDRGRRDACGNCQLPQVGG
jgi:hypothetical protein